MRDVDSGDREEVRALHERGVKTSEPATFLQSGHRREARLRGLASRFLFPASEGAARWGGELTWELLFEVGFNVLAETGDDFFFTALVDFLLNFFEGEVDHVMVVHLEWRDVVVEAEPEAVDEIDLVGGEVGSVRT